MDDWLENMMSPGLDLTPTAITTRLTVAAVAGVIVAAIGHFAHGHRKSDGLMLETTLVLLTVLIAMVTMVIGNSVARAFGLVGALSIVRFRTVVDDTRDTAYVIFAVIVGMAIGAGVWSVPMIGIPLVGILAITLSRGPFAPTSINATHKLTVRIGLGRDPDTSLSATLEQYCSYRTVNKVETVRQGTAIEIIYSIAFRDPQFESCPTQFILELNRIDGVQGAEIDRV